MKVSIIGVGAIGGFIAVRLHNAGVAVQCIGADADTWRGPRQQAAGKKRILTMNTSPMTSVFL